MLPERILNADDHGFAFPHRQVGDDSIVWSGVGSFLQHVGDAREIGAGLRNMPVRGIILRFCLRDARLGLDQPESAVAHAFLRLSKSDFAIRPSL